MPSYRQLEQGVKTYELRRFNHKKGGGEGNFLFRPVGQIALAQALGFLVFVPILSLLPYISIKKNFLFNKFLLSGILIGFIPYLLWTISINPFLEKDIIFYLVEKFNTLSNKNTFTNPFYYYFWNIPVTFLPWSIFAIFGMLNKTVQSSDKK